MSNSAIQLQPGEEGAAGASARRNRIINGQFDIWQRGTSFPAPSGALPADSGFYTSDRWKWQFFGDGGTFNLVTSEVEQATFAPGQTEVPDNPTFYIKWRGEFIGVTNGDEELDLAQQIENARTLAGQKATLSFWAKGDSAGTILVSTRQNLGLGGDVSDLPIFVRVDLTTSWKKFVVVLDVQSIAGKTLGASDQFLSLRFTSILGADVAALTGSITVNYTDTISLANVQFEAGNTASKFEDRFVGDELALCRRYFAKNQDLDTVPSIVDGPGTIRFQAAFFQDNETLFYPNRMRAVPTLQFFNTGVTGFFIAIIAGLGESSVQVRYDAAPGAGWSFNYTADAEL